MSRRKKIIVVDQGSPWRHTHEGTPEAVRVIGEVLESLPPTRLVLSWVDPADATEQSRVTFEIEPLEDMVGLRVTHAELNPASPMVTRVSWGWPRVLSSLKSFLETGQGLNVSAGGGGCGSKTPQAQTAAKVIQSPPPKGAGFFGILTLDLREGWRLGRVACL